MYLRDDVFYHTARQNNKTFKNVLKRKQKERTKNIYFAFQTLIHDTCLLLIIIERKISWIQSWSPKIWSYLILKKLVLKGNHFLPNYGNASYYLRYWVDLLRIILLFITNNEEDIRFSKLIEFIPNRGLYILETNP